MKKINFLKLFCLCSTILVSQNENNFFTIKEKFYNENKRNTTEQFIEEDDNDLQKFKRWENYWETRVDAQGNFPPSDILWTENEKYISSHFNTKTSNTSIANWSFAGPSTFPSGIQGGIGRVNCIAFHPTLQNTFWVGTPGGGLWQTTDGGVSWTTTTDNLPTLGISDIAVDYTNPNILYVATGDGATAFITPPSTRSVGVLKSIDGGLTFNPTGLNIAITAQKLTNRILIHPSNPQILLVAASDGIWRTNNGGTTWSNQQIGMFMDLEFKPTDPTIIYASTLSPIGGSQIFRSIDAGITWNQVSAFTGINRIDLAVSPQVTTVVSALCVNTAGLGGFYGVYSSINNGASFTQVIVGDCTNNMLCNKYDGAACGGQGVYDLAYVIHPSNSGEVWIAGVNNWKTTNNGSSWNLVSMMSYNPVLNPNAVPYLHSDKHRIAFHPLNSNLVYSCSDAGIHVSSNGGTSWTDLSNGLGISQLYRIGTSATTANKVLCGLQDNGLKQSTSSGWLEVMSGDNMEEIIDPIDTNTQYSCALTGLLYRTTDHWANRTIIANNIPGFTAYLTATGFGMGAWITPVVMDPVNNQTLYMGFKDIWKTTDQGNTWAQISNFGLGKHLQHIVVAPSNNQIIYAATYDTLFASGTGGASWGYTIIGNITGNANHKISYITMSPNNPSMLWVTIAGFNSGNKIFKTTNSGVNWTNVSGSLPNVPVNCSVYENGSADGIYIGTDLGVYYRDNTMSDWTTYNTGLPNVQVNELEISSINNKLWAATWGRGLWKTGLFTTTGIKNVEEENSFVVFPNPSNGNFTLQSKYNAEFSIINELGQTVQNFTMSNINKRTINISNLSRGIYFVTARFQDKIISKKVVITE